MTNFPSNSKIMIRFKGPKNRNQLVMNLIDPHLTVSSLRTVHLMTKMIVLGVLFILRNLTP